MNWAAYGQTDPGLKRKNNDDFYLVDAGLGLFVCCDGVGGHAAGNVASEMCAHAVRDHLAQNRGPIEEYAGAPSPAGRQAVADLLRRAIELANERIFHAGEQDAAKQNMSTTLEALLLAGDFAFLGHVGDSRAYLLRSGRVHQLTEDHKLGVEMVKTGMWTAEQARKNPNSRVLTRAVGIQSYVQPDVLTVELTPGDLFLLCSDGLADYFAPAQLAEYAGKHELAELPRQFIEFAKRSGGHDNITAVVVRAEGARAGAATSDAALDALRKSEILGKVPLFRYLSYAELIKVLGLVRLRKFAPGTALIREGATSTEMFVLTQGEVDVLKGGQKITRKGRGDFMGEMGLFDNAPRSASVVAAEPTVAMVIERQDLLTLLRQDAQIAVKFLWALNQEMNQRLRATSLELAETKASLARAKQNQSELPFTVSLEIPLPPPES
jgi:serine/threonine protein phosphatase PrpC